MFFLLIVAIRAGGSVACAATCDWPPTVVRIGMLGDRHVYRVTGLYGERADWERVPTSIYRRFKFFSETDSLAVEPDSAAIRIITDRGGPELGRIIDGLAHVGGFVPTWEEQCERKSDIDESRYEPYRILGVVSPGEQGRGLAPFRIREADRRLLVDFYENPSAWGPRQAVFTVDLWMTPAGGIDFRFSQGDSLAREAVSAWRRELSDQRWAFLRLANGESGTVRFNDTVAHCKGHMRQALRISGPEGNNLWKTEEGLIGVRRIVPVDLDADGVDEIVALGDDHGHPRIVVVGRR